MTGSRGAVRAAVLDVAVVLVFVVIGRANHHAGGALTGLWDTFWPFAAGAAAGMAATRFWRRPFALVPTGTFTTDDHVIKAGVNYRFNLGGPVVARY